ncbi:RNA polymerase sigma factor [Planctomycetota bacterium]
MMKNKLQNESALVCAAQRGDKEALQQLFICNWSWLRGLVYSILGNPDQVDDVLQDICIRVIKNIDSLREPECFRPWLAVMARRYAIRYRRQNAVRPKPVPVEVAQLEPDEKTKTFFNDIEQQEQYDRILRAIESLPEKYREVLMLQHSGDITYAQIAEILDIPVTTVQIRLVRARRMIYDRIMGNFKNKVQEK